MPNQIFFYSDSMESCSPEEPVQHQYECYADEIPSVFLALSEYDQPAPPTGYFQVGGSNDPNQPEQTAQQGLSLGPQQTDPQPGPSNPPAAAAQESGSTRQSSATYSAEDKKADIKERNRRSQAKSRAKRVEQARQKDEKIESLEAEIKSLQAEKARTRQCIDQIMHCMWEMTKDQDPPRQFLEAIRVYSGLGSGGSGGL